MKMNNINPARLVLTTLVLALVVSLVPTLPAWAEGEDGVININTADADALALLPRVGPALAGRILEFREANGAFKAIDDLLLVRGIGERTLELMKPYITLEGKTTLEEKVRMSRAAAALESEGDER
jgi:competence protein ComEA